jgi:hypothetical protein
MSRQCSTSPAGPPTGGERRCRRGYRRRVPFARRVTALLVSGLAAPAFLGSCGSHRDANRFCAAVNNGNAAFDPVAGGDNEKAFAEFDRVARSAPAKLAPDLKTVSTVLRELQRAEPVDSATVARYFAASVRVDRYLHETCGIRIPRSGTL